MGMANSDDEGAIAHRDELLRWAENYPEHPGSYDSPASEEEMAHYHERVRKHVEKKPRLRPKHGDR